MFPCVRSSKADHAGRAKSRFLLPVLPTPDTVQSDEATAEADTNRERQLCVSHSSPWMATGMRAIAPVKRMVRLLHLCFVCPRHLGARILQGTWYHTVDISLSPVLCVPMSPTLSGIQVQHLGLSIAWKLNAYG